MTGKSNASPPLPKRPAWARLLLTLREDLSWGVHHSLINTIAGWALVPRVVRYVLYRAVGYAIATPGIASGCTMFGRDIAIGARTYVNRSCYFEAVAPITIGEDSMLGMAVMLVTSTHTIDGGRISASRIAKPIQIGDRCWLGARVTVLPGVTIGDDVVIGAGAVVTHDCLTPGLYAGIPARWIRPLTDPATDGATSAPPTETGLHQ